MTTDEYVLSVTFLVSTHLREALTMNCIGITTFVLLLFIIYYQIVHEVHKRVMRLLTSSKSIPNERDIKPFRPKINSSTALSIRLQREDLIYKEKTLARTRLW